MLVTLVVLVTHVVLVTLVVYQVCDPNTISLTSGHSVASSHSPHEQDVRMWEAASQSTPF